MFTRQKLGAFYVFTAVIAARGSGPQRKYGDEFAAFITANRLGDIVVTMDRNNRKNVPSHKIRGWVWAPSEANLKKWWAKNGN